MRLTENTFEVSEDFVRWALELAFKKVYENRRERYKDAIPVIKDAIEFRYDSADDFIDNFLDSWCFSIDPYDEVDSRFGADEKSYKEIYEEEIRPDLTEEEKEEYWLTYEERPDQEKLIEDRCNEHNYWCDDSYQLAVQDCFSYSY